MNDLDVLRSTPEGRALLETGRMPPATLDGPGAKIDLFALWSAFRRNLWRFVAAIVGVLLATAAFVVLQKPMYEGKARVAINTQAVQYAPAQVGTANAPMTSPAAADSSAIDTEVTVIGSRRVTQRVVQTLRLDTDPEFSLNTAKHSGPLGALKHAIAGLVGAKHAAAQQSPTDYAIDEVLGRLKVTRFNTTNAIDISFMDPNPRKAAAIANAFAQGYIDDQITAKRATDVDANAFLETQLVQVKQQFMRDEEALQTYRIQHNLLSAGATTLTEQEISNYNQSEVTARADAAADEANLRTAQGQLARGSTGGDVGNALQSPVIQALRGQRATISAHVADLQSRYGPKYPALSVAQKQLSDVDEQIQAEINRVVSNLQAKAEVSRRRLQSIEDSLAQTKGVLSQNNVAQVSLDQLQQNANASQALYQSYLDRLKQTAAQESGERSDARVLSTAPVPTSPSSPRVMLEMLMGLVVGIGLGAVVVVLTEMNDKTIATADDIEQRLNLNYLGGIPLLRSVERRKGASPLDEVVRAPYSAYAEAVRNVRASIRYAMAGDQPLVTAITSALPKEGKTTAAISIARSAALQRMRTVLVDCDVRRRAVNQIVPDAGSRPGLTDVLTGQASLEDALVFDELSGAWILPCGGHASAKEDLFNTIEMDKLLGDLRRRFNFIVLDSPPLLPVADARNIAAKADLLVLMMRWRKTEEQALQMALRLLPHNRVRIAGVVLTQIDMQKQMAYGAGDPGFYFNKYRQYYA